MRMLFLTLAFLFSIGSAHAESLVVQSCGTLPKAYAPGATRNDTVDINGQKCTNDGSGTVAANQGNRGTNTQAWWTQIGDGTNGPVAVKPASTAPAASDPALVVTISPNSTGLVPLGQTTMANSVPVTMASNQGVSYQHIAAGQATTVVKNSPGTIYGIIFNTAATATNVTTIYDNASGSGTVIGIPAATTATIVGQTLNFGPFGAQFGLGLTIITATANGADMTVIYK